MNVKKLYGASGVTYELIIGNDRYFWENGKLFRTEVISHSIFGQAYIGHISNFIVISEFDFINNFQN